MAHTKREYTQVKLIEDLNVYYRKESRFFGLITWFVKERADCIGKDLVIKTIEDYDRIIVNGQIIINKK